MPVPTPQAKAIFVADGWRKRSGDFYTRPVAPGVEAVLALGADRGLPYQWRLKPAVGVAHHRVNELSRALCEVTVPSRYPVWTLRIPLVWLLEGARAQEGDRWLVASEAADLNERVFRDVATAVRDVGWPWAQKRSSLAALVYELRDGNGPWRLTPPLTVALWMQGRVEEAEARLEEVASRFGAPAPRVPAPLAGLRVTSFGSSSPPEGWSVDRFASFCSRLRAAMAEHPHGPPDGWLPPSG